MDSWLNGLLKNKSAPFWSAAFFSTLPSWALMRIIFMSGKSFRIDCISPSPDPSGSWLSRNRSPGLMVASFCLPSRRELEFTTAYFLCFRTFPRRKQISASSSIIKAVVRFTERSQVIPLKFTQFGGHNIPWMNIYVFQTND